MKDLLHNIRFYVLAVSIVISLVVYVWIISTVSLGISQTAKLVEDYGLLSILYLYITLLAGPFCYTFRFFPFRGQYLKARRALGVAACYFAFLHTGISLYGQLDGFIGLTFLDNKYLFAIILGFIALFIFLLLAITSFDYAVDRLTFPKWKLLHRFVYLAGILILIHFVMLGTHYSDLSSTVSKITFFALAFLLLLESPRFDKLFTRLLPVPQFGVSFVLTAVILGIIFFTIINPVDSSNGSVSFDVHAAHRQLAQQALQQTQNPLSGNNNLTNIPGLNGDRNKRYTVSMSADPANPQPNQHVTIHFTVYDASSGNRVEYFRILYAKPMHFIIVNSDLTYFSHLHPVQEASGFVITTQFPKNDLYHLYIQFQPFGGIEQQMAFTLPVGQVPSMLAVSKAQPDADKTKTFGDYAISVDTHGNLNAALMSVGQQTISITVKDARTGKPVTTLKPYLDSFGHLTMINEQTFDFIHVHPYSLTVPPPHANGGPTVDFLPIGIYGPFKSGIYRAFAEFNPDNKLFTADFTVKIN